MTVSSGGMLIHDSAGKSWATNKPLVYRDLY
jgi:hypothetical protein